MATDTESKATLIRNDGNASRPGRTTRSWTLPPDLLTEAVRRLQAVALLYALAYFLAGPFIPLLFPAGRALLFSEPIFWVPAALSIGDALAVAWLVSLRGLSARLKLLAGLSFEVLGSFGIAAAEYHHIAAPISYGTRGYGDFGISWVAVWVMLFTVVVPTPPRVALLSAALSLAAVPIVYGTGVALGSNLPLAPPAFFFSLIFPYLVVLIMAYVGSRVVNGLGAAVREARDMGSYRLVERLGRGGMGEV